MALLLALTLLPTAGCGPRSDRLAVSGNVTLDGAPLDSGSIRLTSIGGEKLVSSGAMIQNGAYQIPQEKGLVAGTYHVELSSPDKQAPAAMDDGTPDGRGIPIAPNRIPAAYNVDSKQTIEVTPDGDNQFDFNVISKPDS
jgi:hypothetical protein